MVEFFQFAFEYGPIAFLFCLPLIACLWVAYRCSSWRRRLALFLALMDGSLLAFQIYALLTKGSFLLLATLLVMLMTPVVLISILFLIIAEGIAKRANADRATDLPKKTGMPTNEDDASA